jgi:hypothetical protein
MQCQLIRPAVAQYGFAASRRHALETYGPEAVKTGDKCFTKQTRRGTNSYMPTAPGFERSAGVKENHSMSASRTVGPFDDLPAHTILVRQCAFRFLRQPSRPKDQWLG